MKKKYLYNGHIMEYADVEDAAKQSNLDVDTYIQKSGIKPIESNYSFNGKNYTAEDILDAANQSKLGFDDYIQKAGFQKKNLGGNDLSAGAKVGGSASAPTQLRSGIGSPELQKHFQLLNNMAEKNNQPQQPATTQQPPFNPKEFLQNDLNQTGATYNPNMDMGVQLQDYYHNRSKELDLDKQKLKSHLLNINQDKSVQQGDMYHPQFVHNNIVPETDVSQSDQIHGKINEVQSYKNDLIKAVGHQASIYAASKTDNPVLAGRVVKNILGDPSAIEEQHFEDKGLPINPAQKFDTELTGINALYQANEENKDNPNYEATKQKLDEQAKTIWDRNPEYKHQQVANLVAQEIIKNHPNDWRNMSGFIHFKEAVDKLKKDGSLTEEDAKNLKYDDVPLQDAGSSAYGTAYNFLNKMLVGGARMVASPFMDTDRLNALAAKSLREGEQQFEDVRSLQNKPYIVGSDLQNIQNPDKGKYNYTFSTISNAIGEGIGNLAGMVGGGKLIGMPATMILSGYEPYYQQARSVISDKPEDEWKRHLYSLLNGSIDYLAFKPLENFGKAAEPEQKELSGILKDAKSLGQVNRTALEGATTKIVNNLIQSGKVAVGEGGKIGAGMTAGEIAKNVIDNAMGSKEGAEQSNNDLGEKIVHNIESLPFSMMIPLGLGELMKAPQHSQIYKENLYNAGLNKDTYHSELAHQVFTGEITPEQAQSKSDAVDAMGDIVSSIPSDLKLTHNQRVDYAYNRVKEIALASKAAQTPDVALHNFYKEKVNDLQKNREDILKGAETENPFNLHKEPVIPAEPVSNEEGQPQNQPAGAVDETAPNLKVGGKIKWDSNGNEGMEDWTVGEKTKTRGGQDAVKLSKVYVESSKDGTKYSKEYADANGIKYDNEYTIEHIVPISELGTNKEAAPNSENDLLGKAKELINNDVVKGYTSDILKEAANDGKSEKLKQFLSEIADQAHDENSAKTTIDTYGKDLVDVATELFPKENKGYTTPILHEESKNIENILGVSGEDADVISMIYNADLTPDEKSILYRQYKNGVMNIEDIQKYTTIDLGRLKDNKGNINKWAKVILDKKGGNKSKITAEDISFEDIPNEAKVSVITPEENRPPNIVEPIKTGETKTETPPENIPPAEPPKENVPVVEGEPSITSIKNEIVDKEREKRGLPPANKAAKKEFGTTWDEAAKELDKNPNAGVELVDELKKKIRPLTDTENAILLHRQIELQNDYDKTNDAINKAAESKDEGELQRNKLRLAGLSDMLQDVYNVGKEAGTQQGRGLATRKMLAKEDFTLASMETKKRAANNGRPLTEDERANLKTMSDRIKELEEKVSKLEEENTLPKEPKNKTKKTDKDFAAEREKIINSIKDKWKNAGKDILSSDIPYRKQLAAIAPDVAKLVKSLVEQGITKLDDVVGHVYNAIKDHIPEIKEEDAKDLVTGKYDSPKQMRVLSPEEEKAKAELERNKMNFRTELEKDRKKNAGILEKGLNIFVKWERAFKLSSPITLAKLTMAALYRTVSTPIEEGIGAGVTALLPKSITKEAYSEAGFNAKAEGRAYTKMFTQGMKDAYATMNLKKGGRSDLEVMYGKEGRLPPEASDFLGHLHGALKAPVKRMAFERSMEKRTTNMIKNGVDVSDPLVQVSIAASAYQDANRSIFMQDNAVSDFWQQHIVGNPKTDLGKFRSAIAQWLVPFAKVPTNIIGETATYAAGSAIGAGKLAHAIIKGTENVTPDQKDQILRCFKKGSIGLGFMLLGYFNPQSIGGYYTGKRKQDDIEVGGLRVFGMDIPQFLVHNPLMETLQIGATIRRVADTYVGNTEEKEGLAKGIVKAGLGLASEIPFVNEGAQLQKLGGTDQDRSDFFGEMAKNTFDPALLQFIAKYTDKSDVKRKPETILEHIKMGIPGLREQVNAKHSYSSEDYKNPTFSYFTDKGLSLPYSSEKQITIKDPTSNKIKKLSDYPEKVKDQYYNTKKKYLEEELKTVEEKGTVYVDRYGNVSESKGNSDDKTEVELRDLNRSQLAKVLNFAATKATEKTKKELFYNK